MVLRGDDWEELPAAEGMRAGAGLSGGED